MTDKDYFCQVLVIDDDPDVRFFITETLLGLGCPTVSMAGSGAEALRVLQSKPIEMIFSDIRMPGMDGIELIRKIAKMGYRGGIAFLSECPQQMQQAAASIAEGYGLKFIRTLDKQRIQPGAMERVLQDNAKRTSPLRLASKSFSHEDDIRRAIADEEMSFVVLPKVSMQEGRCVSAELLCRWKHPSKGEISPEMFLDKLVRTPALYEPFQAYLLKGAAELIKRLVEQQYDFATINLNMPLSAFTKLDDCEAFQKKLRELDVTPEHIQLEINNHNGYAATILTAEALARLRLQGVDLALDNFGVRQSSYDLLNMLPVNELKLEKRFVQRMTTDKLAYQYVKTTIALAHELDLQVTAVGVDSAAHWAMLKNMGCDYAQGFYIAKPVPMDEFIDWIKAGGVVQFT